MVIEFYCGRTKFRTFQFDVFIGMDGTTTFRDDIPRQKGVLRVLVETGKEGVPVFQAPTMFNLIYNHQMVTVAFYGFDQRGVPN